MSEWNLEELKRLHAAATPGKWFATDWQRPSGTFTPTLVATKEEAGSDLESRACDCDHAEHPIENAAWIAAIHNAFPAIVARLEAAQRLRDAAKTAPDILEHMIMTSENGKCPPLHYLLTHEGLYGFHMANLWVRNDGKEYTISADWADNCGRLVKHLTEALAAFDKEQTA